MTVLQQLASFARGISSMEDVRQRCRIDDETGCWHWSGAANTSAYGGRTPTLWVFDSLRGEFRAMTGPIAVLELTGRRSVLGVKMGWRTCQCGDCLNPDHIMGGSKKDHGRWLAANDLLKGNPARIAANRRSGRARSVADEGIVALVRSSTKSGVELAAELGIAPQRISAIRTGRTWNDRPVAGASVFTLGAR
jgi:hypothetical protein